METEGVSYIGPICAFLSSVTWAIGSSNYSKLSTTFTPFSINFTRALTALPCFVLLAFLTEGGWHQGLAAFGSLRASHFGWFTLSMIASYGIGDVLFLWSTLSLGVPGALAIASSYPLQAALLEAFFRGKSFLPLQILGLLMTVGGVVLVILNTPQRVPAEPSASGTAVAETSSSAAAMRFTKPVGILLALGTSLFWMLNGFSVSQGGAGISAPVGCALRMVLALVITAVLSRVMASDKGPRQGSLVLPASTLRTYFWLFAIEAFGGSYFFMVGLARSPLVIGTALSSLAPVLAVPVAWALGLEKPSIYRTLGVLLVVAGLRFLI